MNLSAPPGECEKKIEKGNRLLIEWKWVEGGRGSTRVFFYVFIFLGKNKYYKRE